MWRPALPEAEWAKADASFDREEGNRWQGRGRLPDHWTIDVDGTRFHLSATDFGHLGIFPEQRAQWASRPVGVAAEGARGRATVARACRRMERGLHLYWNRPS